MNPPALSLRGITKRYGALLANRAVDLDAAASEIVALVGENGAGKSTLMRVAAGLVAPDAGEARIRGVPLSRPDPGLAIRLGLGMVHQHFMLVDSLTVAENLVLGCEPMRRGLVDRAAARRAVDGLAAKWGLTLDPDARTGDLAVGERQRLEVLKVLHRGAGVLVLDEPTAVLSPVEVPRLFEMLRRLVDGGAAVVLVTHRLEEVMAASDRVVVMRRGEKVADLRTRATEPRELARLMVGREVSLAGEGAGRRERGAAQGVGAALEVRDLVVRSRGLAAADGVSLAVRPGEVLGVAGVQGNGQTELVEAIAGLRPVASGKVLVGGRDVTGSSPAAVRAAGVVHVPEDRNDRGLVPGMTVAENLALGGHRAFARPFGRLDLAAMALHAARRVREWDIRPADPAAPVGSLSGGNAQKVVAGREIGRVLDRNAGAPGVLLAAEPTRGVDVGAIEAIHARIREAADRGVAVLLVSSDLSEILALSDRVVVMFRGRVAGEADAASATLSRLGEWMAGVSA